MAGGGGLPPPTPTVYGRSNTSLDWGSAWGASAVGFRCPGPRPEHMRLSEGHTCGERQVLHAEPIVPDGALLPDAVRGRGGGGVVAVRDVRLVLAVPVPVLPPRRRDVRRGGAAPARGEA